VADGGGGNQTIDHGQMAAVLLVRRGHAAPDGGYGDVNRQDTRGVPTGLSMAWGW
jgi:hypothetical protein